MQLTIKAVTARATKLALYRETEDVGDETCNHDSQSLAVVTTGSFSFYQA